MGEWSEEQLRTAAELYGQVIGEGRTPKEALAAVMRFAVGEPPAGACEHRHARYGCAACSMSVRIRYREFPLQVTRGLTGPVSIPWAVAEKAWAAYSARYGRDQSVERLAQRGGFSWGEMDELFPGWRDATDAWKKLEAEHQRVLAALNIIQQVGSVRGGTWCAGQALRALAGQPLLPLDGTRPPLEQREGSR